MSVNIKQGPFRKTTFPFANILHWYVYEDKTYRSLFISYNNDLGKQKKIQLFAQLGEPGFADIIEAFNQTIAAKNLNHLPKKEAFKIMKAADPKKVGAFGAMIVIFALTTTFMFPGLCHYFDFGFDEEVYVEELIEGDYDSRNMNLLGYPLGQTLEETYTKGSTTTITYYVPIVGESWEEGDRLDVVLKFSEDDYENADEDAIKFKGVARNVWHEGLDTDQEEFFNSEYGFEVSEDVIMFEVTNEEHNDSGMFFGWLAINGLFVIIFGVVYIRSK